MSRSTLEVADIVRTSGNRFWEHYGSHLAWQHRKVLDAIVRCRTAALELAGDPKHLGADIGFLGVLHTWGQNLHHHPHIHYVVPAGGLAPDGSRWIPSSRRFFLPVAALSRVFRGDRKSTRLNSSH